MKWMQLPFRRGRDVDLVRSWWVVRDVVERFGKWRKEWERTYFDVHL